MKQLIAALFFLFAFQSIAKQKTVLVNPLSYADSVAIAANEDSLFKLMNIWNTDSIAINRLEANSSFIKLLGRTLKMKNSFFFPFDRLKNTKILQEPDAKFRIITWRVLTGPNGFKYFGCLQYGAPSFKIVPLHDLTAYLSGLEDTTLTEKSWLGAVYYNLIPIGKNRYTLIGLCNTEPFYNQKVMDVLEIKKDSTLQFGAEIFTTDTAKKIVTKRVFFTYRFDAGMNLRYSQEYKAIMADHLIPPDEKSRGIQFNYVPDGSVDFFKWKKGKWIFFENYQPK